MFEFAFLFFVALGNFMIGVGAAVCLGRAPRNLQFLTRLLIAFEQRRQGGLTEDDTEDSQVSREAGPAEAVTIEPTSTVAAQREPAPAAETTASPSAVQEPQAAAKEPAATEPRVVDVQRDAQAPFAGQDLMQAQLFLEEMIIDMAAQEVHLRQIRDSVRGTTGNAADAQSFDCESVVAEVSADTQKLLTHFNEARFLIEKQREFAAEASQASLAELDVQWDAITQQSMQLLVISSDSDSPDAVGEQIAAICDGVLSACGDTRQTCAAFLANASLERPLGSA